MKNLLFGLFLLPALVGVLLLYHTLILQKPDGQGGNISNRIVRVELAWLALNKPHLFTSVMPSLLQNVEKRNGFQEAALLKSNAFDYEYFVANNPDLNATLLQDENLVKQYWLGHLNECRVSSPVFNVKNYQAKNTDIKGVFGEDCTLATYHWSKHGAREGRVGI